MGAECDEAKAEKAALQQQVDTYVQELAFLKEKINVMVREIESRFERN